MTQEFTARLLSKFRVQDPHIRLTPIESGLLIHYPSEQKQFPTELVTREQLISCRIAGTIPESSHASTAELIYYRQLSPDESRNYTGLALRRRKMLLLFTSCSSARQFVHHVREVFLRNTARKPYVFFLNPRSGSGKAFKIFHKHVVPTLVRLSIPFAVFQTQHAGDVEQWVKTRSDADLSSYRALVTVSGDGLLFEVVNGLASRPQSDFNIPIGVVPAGGGNATAGAVCYYSGLSFRHDCLRHSVFILSHPEPSSTDNPSDDVHLINRGMIPPNHLTNALQRVTLFFNKLSLLWTA
ncbi:sphingosine kinase [Clonorchis sinensis]|uniref:Sphingosine kinase n=1 Tax=Clonorchis sinensis TaxID=79923 RepID=G7YAI9_CLOSI|nr:sphingosine kinase [Clonorchis sinensis]